MTFGKMTLAAMLLASAGASQAAIVFDTGAPQSNSRSLIYGGGTVATYGAKFSLQQRTRLDTVTGYFGSNAPNAVGTATIAKASVNLPGTPLFSTIFDISQTSGYTGAQNLSTAATGQFSDNTLEAGDYFVLFSADAFNPGYSVGFSIDAPQPSSVNVFIDERYSSYISTMAAFAFRLEGTAITAAVPEPATWGMMILGFGLAGGALRRRRTRALA